MEELDEPLQSLEAIRAQINEAKRKTSAASLKRDTRHRRTIENKQRKGRVNHSLLRGMAPARDETWTIRARGDLIKQVKQLAEDLSEPRARVSIAALMEEAMELLIAKYQGGENA